MTPHPDLADALERAGARASDLDAVSDQAVLEMARSLVAGDPRGSAGLHVAATGWCELAACRVAGIVELDPTQADEDAVFRLLESAFEPHDRLSAWLRRAREMGPSAWLAMMGLLVLWPAREHPERFAAVFEEWARQWPKPARTFVWTFPHVVHDDPELSYLLVDLKVDAASTKARSIERAWLATMRWQHGDEECARDRAALDAITPFDFLNYGPLCRFVIHSIQQGLPAPRGVLDEALALLEQPETAQWGSAVCVLCTYPPTEEMAITAWARAIREAPDPGELLRLMLFGPMAEALFSAPRWDARELPRRLLPVTLAILERHVRPGLLGLMTLFLQSRERWDEASMGRAYERLRDVFAFALLEIARDGARVHDDRRRAAAALVLSGGACTEGGLAPLTLLESLATDRRGLELARLAKETLAEQLAADVARPADDRLSLALCVWCGDVVAAPQRPARRPTSRRKPRPRHPARKKGRAS